MLARNLNLIWKRQKDLLFSYDLGGVRGGPLTSPAPCRPLPGLPQRGRTGVEGLREEVVLQEILGVGHKLYYEEVGLISSSGRRRLRRIFEDAMPTRLSLISLG